MGGGGKFWVAVVCALFLLSLLSPWIAPSYTKIDVTAIFEGPSKAHWLGTDDLGRDLLARLIHGGRLTLLIALGAALISVVVGAVWGAAAADSRSFADEVLMRLADAAMAVPVILLALVLVAAFGATPFSLTVITGLLLAPITARVARAAVLSELRTDYYEAAVAAGMPRKKVLVLEVVPNVTPAVIAQGTLNMAWAIGVEASLSFLGVGLRPPQTSWGTLLREGYQNLYQSTWYPAIPATLIFFAVLSFNTIGARMQGALDPRSVRL